MITLSLVIVKNFLIPLQGAIVMLLLVLSGQSVAAPIQSDFFSREVRVTTDSWGVGLDIPLSEFTKGFQRVKSSKWSKIESDKYLLVLSSFDPVSAKTSTYRILATGYELGRQYALITRIIVDGVELSGASRGTFARNYIALNGPLRERFSKWYDSIQNSGSKKIGSSELSVCDSSDSTVLDGQFDQQTVDDVMPIYPKNELEKGVVGVVGVSIGLDKFGAVFEIDIHSSGGDTFDSAVVSAIRSSRFKPLLKSGCIFRSRIKKKYVFQM